MKYDQGTEKLPWDLLPYKATEGLLRVLLYGKRKYSVCKNCTESDGPFKGNPTRIYPNPRLDGDLPRDNCPKCESTNIYSGAHNWRNGFEWTRLIAAAFRHLVSIAKCEDIDKESGEPHVFHLLCMVSFIAEHQIDNLGNDDRYREKLYD